MGESPVRKKFRGNESFRKRHGEDDDAMKRKKVKTNNKRVEEDCDSSTDGHVAPKHISNFVLACHEVAYNNFVDFKSRFLLKFLPRCVNPANCEHANLEKSKILVEVPGYAIEVFNIDFKSHMWSDCINICRNIIRPGNYLPAKILRNLMEIILNAHEDPASGFTIPYLIDTCHQTMFLVYDTNPPCVEKVRTVYKDFLTILPKSSSIHKERKPNDYDEGFFKYCLNRISKELQCQIEDTSVQPDADEINHLLGQNITTINLEKKKYEVHEKLERPERIKRVMAVLKCLVDILEIDLAIWHSRHTYNSSKYMTRSAKPLIAYILWNHVLLTGSLTDTCKQILKIFVKFIELKYPEEYLDIITRIVNAMVQTFDVCENRTANDYPYPGRYCSFLADGLFSLIKGLPIQVINDVIDKVEPKFFKYMLGTKYFQLTLNTIENDVLQISIDFLQKNIYSEFVDATTDKEEVPIMKKPKTLKHFYLFFHKVTKVNKIWLEEESKNKKKLDTEVVNARDNSVNKEQIIYLLYITLKYYLEAFRVQEVHELSLSYSSTDKEKKYVNILNRHNIISECPTFNISENFVKKYRSIFQLLKKLIVIFKEIKESPDFVLFQKFVRLRLLDL